MAPSPTDTIVPPAVKAVAADTRRSRILHVAIALVLGAAAAYVLYRELRGQSFDQLWTALRSIPSYRLFTAGGLTVVSYTVLTFYDLLALRWLGIPLSYRKTALASFLGYVFSHNIGMSLVGASAARYRIYSAFGLNAEKVFKIVAFCATTFWVGLLALSGIVLLARPQTVEQGLGFSRAMALLTGGGLLAAGAGYVVLCAFRRRSIKWHKVEFTLPTTQLALLQLLISLADWLLAASVVFSLLPSDLPYSFLHVVAAYAAAMSIAGASHVPGGLGVLEGGLMKFLVVDESAKSAVFAGLLVFRGLYYLAPLALGTLLLAGFEFGRRVESSTRRSRSST
jgi:uncharacterized membrane protein YbhN (UPF0104 family)